MTIASRSRFILKALCLVACFSLCLNVMPVAAQSKASPQTGTGVKIDMRSGRARLVVPPLPSERVLSRLVWTSMITLDNANRTGDYSILYRLGSPGFQQSQNLQSLSALFQPLRDARVDVGRVIHQTPEFYLSPGVDENGIMRLRGGFDDRPRQIRFDILFDYSTGAWRIHGISVVDMESRAPR
ncbi:hypothetical protein [Algimonas porphyrae]|nr:hypothetical protein [Algimonas porphyrae]